MKNLLLRLAAAWLLAGSANASAEEWSEELIQSQHRACVASCSKNAPEDRCETMCDCADDQVRNYFTAEDYNLMTDAIVANPTKPHFPSSVKPKVEKLLLTCFGRLRPME